LDTPSYITISKKIFIEIKERSCEDLS